MIHADELGVGADHGRIDDVLVDQDPADGQSFGVFHIGDQKQGLLEGDGEIGLVQSHRRMTSRTFHWQVLLQFSFDPPPHLQGRHHRLVLKIKFKMSITDYDENERRKMLDRKWMIFNEILVFDTK